MAMIGRGAADRPGQGRRAARQARVRGLAGRPRRAHDRRQQPRRRVQELGDGLLRQGTRAARRSTGAGRRGWHWEEDDDASADAPSTREEVGDDVQRRPTTTSSSSAAAPAAARSRGTSPRPGKRILILERGDWLPREIENWDADEVFVKNRYVPKDTWYDDKDKALPAGHPLLRRRRRRSSTARRSTGCGREDFGELRHHDGISPAWPISYDDMEPYYTKAEQLYEVHGNHGEDPTEGHASAPVPVPGGDPRAAHPAAVRRPRAGRLPPVPRAVRRPAARGRPSRTAGASGARPATASRALVQAKSDAEMLGVRPALEHPNVTLLTNAPVVTRLDDRTPPGPTVTGSRSSATARRRPTTPTSSSSRPAPPTRPSSCSRRPTTATRTGSPTAPDQVGRQLHVPQQRGGPGDLEGTEPDDVPEDARRQRLLLRDDGLRRTRWATSRWSASRRRADVQGREAAPDQARADVLARRGRQARRRLLAVDRGPAGARQPRHARHATATSR